MSFGTRIGKAWSADLQCSWESWTVHSDGQLELRLPEGNVCDMAGALKIAKAIEPDVFMVMVYVDGVIDVEYRRRGDEWTAYDWRNRA